MMNGEEEREAILKKEKRWRFGGLIVLEIGERQLEWLIGFDKEWYRKDNGMIDKCIWN